MEPKPSASDTHLEAIGQAVVTHVGALTSGWTAIDCAALSRAEATALTLCVWSGLAELEMTADAISHRDPADVRRVVSILSGVYELEELANTINSAIPDWRSTTISVQTDATVLARLTQDGRNAHDDVHAGLEELVIDHAFSDKRLPRYQILTVTKLTASITDPSEIPPTAGKRPPADGAAKKPTKEEANQLGMELLRDPQYQKIKPFAKAIGRSTGWCSELPIWRAFQAEKKRGRVPKAISLTDGILSEKGSRDPELERLIAEQSVDFEESPLVAPTRRGRGRRSKV